MNGTTTAKRSSTALVLCGGGARGAYQVGVLRGLYELGVLDPSVGRVDTFVGSSAGAINAGMLAAYAGDLGAGLAGLERVWGNLEAKDVFRTDVRSIGGIGVRWAWDLTFGGALGGGTPKSLLDTAPLRQLLEREVPLHRLDGEVRSGALRALAITATDLQTADGTVFLHGAADLPRWTRRRWRIEPTQMRAEHLLASSAIPIFFPTVEIDGRHFGDGSIRNTRPLSPAINLGVDKIIAVSVREPSGVRAEFGGGQAPSIAQIAGVLLDAVMLDAIEVDVEHSERVNRSVMACPGEHGEGFRMVDVLWLRPSRDLTAIAAELAHQIPAVVRYVMRGLGSEEAITELTSYLLFDASFCGRLIEIGREDALAARAEVEAFFAAPLRRSA